MADRHDYHSSSHHHHRQHPYGGRGGRRGRGRGGRGRFRGGGRGGGRRSGNRFQAEHVDPKQQVWNNLLSMMTQVGLLKEEAPPATMAEDSATAEDAATTEGERSIVVAQAKNLQLLADVVCGSNYDMFMQNDPNASDLALKYGPMVTNAVHCASLFGLQTHIHSTLSLLVHETALTKINVDQAFLPRCVEYSVRMLGRDLDLLLLHKDASEDARHLSRCKFLLRYLCDLQRLHIIQEGSDVDPGMIVPSAINSTSVGLVALLQAVLQAAKQTSASSRNLVVLCNLLLHAVPFLEHESNTLLSTLVEPIAELVQNYTSEFAPGRGKRAILLKSPQVEEFDEDEDDEEVGDEDEDDEQDSGQVCDSLQDALRAVKHYLNNKESSSRFAFFTDAPWKVITAPGLETDQPLTFTGEPLLLSIFPAWKGLTSLLRGQSEEWASGTVGLVFGRLPIFGSPPDLEDTMDDEDDEGGEEDETPVTNERLQAYQKEFGLVDRYFVAEAVREILITQESCVTETGVEHGSPKNAAEHIWSIRFMIKGETEDPARGIEYVIVETILSLIAQSSEALHRVNLARVLLELTKLEPNLFPGATALAVSNLFEIYMPSLTCLARSNLAQWFAFHLIHTDFQWPDNFWKHWESHLEQPDNSRVSFVRQALEVMAENDSQPDIVVAECLPKESGWADYVLPSKPPPLALPDDLDSVAAEVKDRVGRGDDPVAIQEYLKQSEIVADARAELTMVVRAILQPARSAYEKIVSDMEASKTGMHDGLENNDPSDLLDDILESIANYKPLLTSTDMKEDEIQVLFLQALEEALFWSRGMLSVCICTAIDSKIVSVANTLKFLLGDTGGELRVVARWWELAESAIQIGLVQVANESVADMDDDTSPKDSSQQAALAFLDTILSYTVRQISTILSETSESSKGSYLSVTHADLVEGFKNLVLFCEESIGKPFHVSSVSGPQLSNLLDAGSSTGIDILRRALERM